MQVQSIWRILVPAAGFQEVNSFQMESRKRNSSELAVIYRISPSICADQIIDRHRRTAHPANSQSILETVLIFSNPALRHGCGAFRLVSICVVLIYRHPLPHLEEERNWNTSSLQRQLQNAQDILHPTPFCFYHRQPYGHFRPINTISMSISTMAEPLPL